VKLPLAPSRVVIFRNDLLGFSYEPLGDSLALQSWVTTGQVVPGKSLKAVELHATGPMPAGPQAQIMGISARLAGDVWNSADQWAMHVSSCDGITKMPQVRWDVDFYYMEGDAAAQFGKSYTCHGGFCNLLALTSLATDFFGFTEAEGRAMSPNQKMVIEVGYEIFWRCGYTRERLQGQSIGVFLGDCGTDWHAGDVPWSVNMLGGGAGGDALERTLGQHASVTCGRLSWIYDLQGPIATVDTACSSTLIATHQAHMQQIHHMLGDRKGEHAIADRSLCIGTNILVMPESYVGNCAGNMLSHIGRCFTFDRTADGYQRGEGCDGLFLQCTDRPELVTERLACLSGSAANQDGRSATLTAPNGPSQQACIRMSLFMAGLDPTHVNVAECHGTGTALGDPIEVGALQATMRSGRTFPILHTSSKTNVAHLEAAAGSTGLLKCVLIASACVGPPNCHLRALNPHLTVEGYPVLFDTEASDEGHNCCFCGVSSFGFGGANSRGDVFSAARRGHRSVYDNNMNDPIQIRSPDAIPRMELGMNNSWRDQHRLAAEDPLPNITIVGTFNGWSSPEPMEKLTECLDKDVYRAHIVLGDAGYEHFQLLVNGDMQKRLYPERQFGTPLDEVLGPGEDPQKRAWTINGKEDGVRPGTVYKIKFAYTRRLLSWEVLSEPNAIIAELWGNQFYHRYFLTGDFNDWSFSTPMARMADEDGVERYVADAKFCPSGAKMGTVQFQIIRDQDWDQTLYPVGTGAADGLNVHADAVIQGLDPYGDGLNWQLNGEPGASVPVELLVEKRNGSFHVKAAGMDWRSPLPDKVVTSYWITSAANDWNYLRLWPVPDVASKRCKALFNLGALDEAEFHIEVNAGQTGQIYTPTAGIQVTSEEAVEEGTWAVKGLPGQEFVVWLDLNKDDSSQVVTWTRSHRGAILC